MTNHYARGADRERQLVARLKDDGYAVTRTAGSHGAADLWAKRRGEPLRLIQLKAGLQRWPSPAERDRLRALADQAGSTEGEARAEIAWWPPRQPIIFYTQDEWPP